MLVELSEKDLQTLNVALGFAVGSAMAQKDKPLAYRFLALSNRINKDNEQWFPYEIPDEYKEESNATTTRKQPEGDKREYQN